MKREATSTQAGSAGATSAAADSRVRALEVRLAQALEQQAASVVGRGSTFTFPLPA